MGLPDIDNIPDTGAVFTIGRSRFAENVASHFFIRKDPVVSVTCGDEHSAVVCQSGRLFVFGSNDWGQLGLGHKNHVSKPSCVKILKPEKVTHVACGRAHTLICTAEQKIFACGSDQESQLGRGGQTVGDSSNSPFMIWDSDVDGPKICDIAAGSHHSLALMKDGTVYAWGSNLEGQLGLPGTSGLVNKPTKVHVPEPVKQISAGYYHSAFLTESGNVYVCGEAESGKLGIALDFRTQVAPKQMQLSGPAILVACGGHHTLVFGEDGNIYCTGSNSSGQLGMGTDVTEIQTPQILPRGALQGEIIKKIGCGESHVAIVTESGKLFTCGDGRHGKLGLEENENNVHELTLASKYQELVVTDVACGGCHTILVGRRREMDNEEIDGQDQLGSQKKNNPLPPLKIPLARIPSGNGTSAKSEPEQMDAENNLNEEHPASPEVTTESGTNGPTDSVTSVEKPESPMKIADYEETISKMSTNSDEKDDENERIMDNNNDEKMSTDVNNENNIDEMKKESELPISPKSSGLGVSRIASAERARSAGSNAELEKATGDNADLEKLTGSSADLEKLAGSKDDLEESVNSNGDLETGEKVDSPPLPVPPPKPPRQKIGSAENSQSSRQGSSSSRVGSTGSAGKNTKSEDEHATESVLPIDGGELVTSEEEKTKSEDGSEKKSAGSEKSRSAKSKAGTDETAEADAQNNLDDVEDNGTVEDVTKVVQDDTDVVHSPPTRAGKMAKLFKTKKQEVENGTKASSAVITKAKSKTCIIL